MTKLLDLVYPPKCAVCGTLGPEPICSACFSHFEPHEPRVKKADPPLDYAGALFDYTGYAAGVVQRLKYERVTTVAAWMAALLAKGAEERGLLDVDCIVPVPIHWRRRVMRGFNQAEILCESMPEGIVRLDVLKRSKPTRPQVGLTHEERTTNLEGAFEVMNDVTGLRILLVDDVLTSGGTAEACSSALKEKGADEVGLLVFASDPRWRS
jgi:ComF family protein